MTTLFEEQMGARVQTPLFEFCAKPGLSSRRPAGDWQLATTTTATGTVTTLGGTTLATTTTFAASAALNAGFAGLAASASVSLINNGGDLGKTLRELGSKDSLKSLLLSMATAGALNGLSNSLTINGQTLASITPQTADFGANLVRLAGCRSDLYMGRFAGFLRTYRVSV